MKRRKVKRAKVKRAKVKTMARRRSYKAKRSRRRSSSGSLLKQVLYGAVGGFLAPKVPILNSLPYSSALGGVGANYLMKQKSSKALLIGAVSGYFVPSLLGMSGNNGSISSLFDGITQ